MASRVFSSKGLAERIRVARKRQDITQADLAHELGCVENAVSYWERACREPRAQNLALIAITLNVSVDWLLFGDDEA